MKKPASAASSNMRGGALQGQDPGGWAGEAWMDVIIPMDYQMQSLQVRADERRFLEALDDDDKLVTGLSLYMRSGAEAMSRPPELVREQINTEAALHGPLGHPQTMKMGLAGSWGPPEQAAPATTGGPTGRMFEAALHGPLGHPETMKMGPAGSWGPPEQAAPATTGGPTGRIFEAAVPYFR